MDFRDRQVGRNDPEAAGVGGGHAQEALSDGFVKGRRLGFEADGPVWPAVTVGGAQVDCSIVKALTANSRGNPWALAADARIRIWPGGAAWIDANTFGYPVRQRWFAGPTQMANEPTFVDGVESPLVMAQRRLGTGVAKPTTFPAPGLPNNSPSLQT